MTRVAATRLGVLLSGSGRTLVNLAERIAAGALHARIACVISDRCGVKGIQRADELGLPCLLETDATRTFDILRAHRVDLVCLAGYLRLLQIPPDFEGRVLNIHPSLLPEFGGKGYYGAAVHRAVLAAGRHESGCTVHVCDNQYDTGPILAQRRVPVLADDTPETLAARVFAAECETYPQAIAAWQQRHAADRCGADEG